MGNRQGEAARKKLGEKLRIAREKNGSTQAEVAEKAEMSSNYFAKIERGEINVTLETLYKIIKALGVEASDIFPT